MLLVLILIIIFLCVIDFFIIRKLIKNYKSMENDRCLFVEYLKKINDYEMLKNIGEINMFGQYERWYPSPNRILKKLKEKLDNKDYFDYYEKYSQNLKSYTFFVFFSGLILFVVLNIVSFLFKYNN